MAVSYSLGPELWRVYLWLGVYEAVATRAYVIYVRQLIGRPGPGRGPITVFHQQRVCSSILADYSLIKS